MNYYSQPIKDPDAVWPYTVDWSDILPAGDTIAACDVTADAGITVDSSSLTDTTTIAVLSGGSDGVDYAVKFHVTTEGDYEDERTILVRCRER